VGGAVAHDHPLRHAQAAQLLLLERRDVQVCCKLKRRMQAINTKFCVENHQNKAAPQQQMFYRCPGLVAS
jgi:hypothetical protein